MAFVAAAFDCVLLFVQGNCSLFSFSAVVERNALVLPSSLCVKRGERITRYIGRDKSHMYIKGSPPLCSCHAILGGEGLFAPLTLLRQSVLFPLSTHTRGAGGHPHPYTYRRRSGYFKTVPPSVVRIVAATFSLPPSLPSSLPLSLLRAPSLRPPPHQRGEGAPPPSLPSGVSPSEERERVFPGLPSLPPSSVVRHRGRSWRRRGGPHCLQGGSLAHCLLFGRGKGKREGRKEGGVRSFVRCGCCNVSVTSVLKRGGRGVTYSKKKKKTLFYIQGDSKYHRRCVFCLLHT